MTTTPIPQVLDFSPFVHPNGKLRQENFETLQKIVAALNGTVDTDTGFLYTVIMGVRIWVGTGSPENVVTGRPPDIYLNLSGGAGTTVYCKSSGTDTNTGWLGL